jgi:hypothetical protein
MGSQPIKSSATPPPSVVESAQRPIWNLVPANLAVVDGGISHPIGTDLELTRSKVFPVILAPTVNFGGLSLLVHTPSHNYHERITRRQIESN